MVSAATQFVSEEGYGQGAPAHLGPQAQASAGAAVVNEDGVEILDADAPLATVMSPLSAFLSHASLEAGDNQARPARKRCR
jgi:DNA helicase-2/ATP-dependent DNA helicase PcrA